MPFYEYECSNCKFYVEALQKISDEPLKKCPSCGKQTMKKLVSAPVFRLKGDGWYETDFKSDEEKKRNLAGGEEAPETKPDEGKKDEPKTEAKAEPKADKKPAAAAAKKPAAKPVKVAAKSARAKPAAKPKPKAKPAKKK
jgi:putative FmdB family regulatory protein